MRNLVVVALCLVALGAWDAHAQGFVDTSIVLIPLRSPELIRADIDAANNQLQVAEARVPVVEGAEKQAQHLIDPWSKQIDLVNAKIDVAKKEKSEAGKVAGEAEKKVLEQKKKLAENNYDLRKAETDLAKADRDLLKAQIKYLQLESELAEKRIQRDELVKAGTTSVGLTAVNELIAEVLRKALEADREVADKTGNKSDKYKSVVNKRLDILQTQTKLLQGS